MFQQDFCTHCSKNSQLLIVSDYIKDSRYLQNKSEALRSGDRAGPLTGPPRPIHRQLKV